MAFLHLNALQEMVQRIEALATEILNLRTELQNNLGKLRFEVGTEFRAIEQRLESQIVDRHRIHRTLRHKIGTIEKRLDRLDRQRSA